MSIINSFSESKKTSKDLNHWADIGIRGIRYVPEKLELFAGYRKVVGFNLYIKPERNIFGIFNDLVHC